MHSNEADGKLKVGMYHSLGLFFNYFGAHTSTVVAKRLIMRIKLTTLKKNMVFYVESIVKSVLLIVIND